jgi:hypothetical protein
MKKILFCTFLVMVTSIACAQNTTYDLVSFIPPAGWKKDVKADYITYMITSNKKGTWCQISIVKSTASKGSIEADFESEWQLFAVKGFKATDEPQLGPVKELDGWQTTTGTGKFIFNNKEATVMLTTSSGYNRCVSIVASTNSGEYIKDIDSFMTTVSLQKQDVVQQPVVQQPPVGNAKIIGSWGKSNTVSQLYNRFGNYSYNKQQYTFNADGSYSFIAKNYDEQNNETLLIKEYGSFTINGNNVTITPKSSVIEAWSKKNGADNWNQLKSTQKRPLEIVTYQFSIQANNLLLQSAQQTERDGRFNYENIYTYGPPGTFTPIQLPGK